MLKDKSLVVSTTTNNNKAEIIIKKDNPSAADGITAELN